MHELCYYYSLTLKARRVIECNRGHILHRCRKYNEKQTTLHNHHSRFSCISGSDVVLLWPELNIWYGIDFQKLLTKMYIRLMRDVSDQHIDPTTQKKTNYCFLKLQVFSHSVKLCRLYSVVLFKSKKIAKRMNHGLQLLLTYWPFSVFANGLVFGFFCFVFFLLCVCCCFVWFLCNHCLFF